MTEAAVEVEATEPQAAETADIKGPTRKRGVSGNPRGVSGPNKSGKYVARASFKTDPRGKAQQRAIGSFETKEEAAAAVIAKEAELAAGSIPWDVYARINQHKRGEVSVVHASATSCCIVSSYVCPLLCRHRRRRRRSDSRASGI